jgi:D-lactate dehydrogenase
MRRIKTLLDPDGILNPGVVLNDDPQVHLKNLKPMPSISALADRCIECGYCEPRCPSRDLTLTPRQRIQVTRELAQLQGEGEGPEARELGAALLADFAYDGVATCAGDSMCQTSCPVKIDTGALVKEMKTAVHSPLSRRVASLAARHFGLLAFFARSALRAAHALRLLPGGGLALESLTELLSRALPTLLPRVGRELELPGAAPRLPAPPTTGGGSAVVYFPSCLTRILGPLPGEGGLPPARAALDLLAFAGGVRYPKTPEKLCCGMPFASRGFPEAARTAAAKTAEALWRSSREGRDLVVTDASPCAGTLQELAVGFLKESGRQLCVLDFPTFWAREVLPGRPALPRRGGTAVLHPTCTLVRRGGLGDLLAVARAHCETVVVPGTAECCGFAGDRGFLVPELTRSATAREAAEVKELLATPESGFYSSCRTCEIGMSRAVGRPCRSLLLLVHEAVFGA